MKSSLTRRTFIKRSVVGAVAIANATLLVGLVSAEVSSPADCRIPSYCNGEGNKTCSCTCGDTKVTWTGCK
jgi:hypothetical protein